MKCDHHHHHLTAVEAGMIITDEAVAAAANQLRSQINDFTSRDILMQKRARMILRAALPYLESETRHEP